VSDGDDFAAYVIIEPIDGVCVYEAVSDPQTSSHHLLYLSDVLRKKQGFTIATSLSFSQEHSLLLETAR